MSFSGITLLVECKRFSPQIPPRLVQAGQTWWRQWVVWQRRVVRRVLEWTQHWWRKAATPWLSRVAVLALANRQRRTALRAWRALALNALLNGCPGMLRPAVQTRAPCTLCLKCSRFNSARARRSVRPSKRLAFPGQPARKKRRALEPRRFGQSCHAHSRAVGLDEGLTGWGTVRVECGSEMKGNEGFFWVLPSGGAYAKLVVDGWTLAWRGLREVYGLDSGCWPGPHIPT